MTVLPDLVGALLYANCYDIVILNIETVAKPIAVIARSYFLIHATKQSPTRVRLLA